MPVRFNCSECESLLSVGRRMIGETIDCPKCGSKQHVPETDAISGAKVEKRIPRGQRRAADEPEVSEPPAESVGTVASPAAGPEDDYYADVEFVIYEDEEDARGASSAATFKPPPGSIATSLAASLLDPSPAETTAPKPAVPAMLEGPPRVDGDVIEIPRSLWNSLLTACVLLCIAAFVLGYWLGTQPFSPRLSAAPVSTAAIDDDVAAPTGSVVQGRMHYRAGPGLVPGDGGAVVIALRMDAVPVEKVPIKGLRPDDNDADRAKAKSALGAIGGSLQQAVSDGSYLLTLPSQGRYRLLLISNHAGRRGGVRGDAAELKPYFDSVDLLLRDKEYRIIQLDARAALVQAPACEFGE